MRTRSQKGNNTSIDTMEFAPDTTPPWGNGPLTRYLSDDVQKRLQDMCSSEEDGEEIDSKKLYTCDSIRIGGHDISQVNSVFSL